MIENNINEKTYYYWQRKLRKESFKDYSSDMGELPPLKSREELSFIELTKPKNRMQSEEQNTIVHPAAILKTDSLTIAIINDISDPLLSRILREVSNA